MHGAKNLNPVITLKNLLPPGRGPMLRDGPALAIGVRSRFRVPLPLLPLSDGRTGELFNAESAKLKTEPRATCRKCGAQHDRNGNAVINV